MKGIEGTTHAIYPLSIRADLAPASLDVDARTVDLTWTTGAAVLRRTFWDGDFYEELSLDPTHVRMGRLENGAPLLAVHNSAELESVLGVVERAEVKDGTGKATVRFSKSPEGEAALQRVAEGVLRNVSVGYRVYRYEKTEEEGKLPTFRATDWEPFEISLVPMGADAGASVRAAGAPTNPCEIVARLGGDMSKMKDPQSVAPASIPEVPAEPVTRAEPIAADVAKIESAAAAKERARGSELRRMAGALGIDDAVAQRWIDDGTEVDAARAEAIGLLIAQRQEAPCQKIDGHHHVEVGDDLGREGARRGVVVALLHRGDPDAHQLDDAGREFRGMTLIEMARAYLERNGISTRGLGKREVAGMALGLEVRVGMHSTSDFPLLLADVMGKTLRRAYMEAPATFTAWARRVTLPDFRQVKRTQLGEAPALVAVPEGAEFTMGTIGEAREVYALTTYGRRFAVTRQTLINDDLDALSRLPMLFGRSARDLESNLVYTHFAGNPTMGDGVALFHSTHGNLGTGAISVTSIGAGRAAMRKQKGLDGAQRINVQAKTLLVPAAIETTADQFVSQNLLADSAGNVNVFAGRLQVVAEPRLDDTSAAEWYLVADPAAIDTLEYGYLEGEEGVALESRVGFEIDGVEVKARLDFGVKAIDWRGFYKSSGA